MNLQEQPSVTSTLAPRFGKILLKLKDINKNERACWRNISHVYKPTDKVTTLPRQGAGGGSFLLIGPPN